MNTTRTLGIASLYLLAAAASAGLELGCTDLRHDCSLFDCGASGAGGGSSSSLSGGGSGGMPQGTGTGGGGGGGGGGGPNCDPTQGDVAGSCGIFVSSSLGSDGDAGTKSKPVKSLAHALSIAAGAPIYACGEDFHEAVTVAPGTTLYGALDCAHGWAYAPATKTGIVGPADAVAVTLTSGAAETRIADVAITSADATQNGGSSIALFASGATATLERCTVTSGAGVIGAAGAHQDDVVTAASADGKVGAAGCVDGTSLIGGDGGTNACASANGGGVGGTGTASSGGPGGNGDPQGAGTAPKDGLGGAGGTSCDAGHQGGDGGDGAAGTGSPALGALAAAGYVAPTATDGAEDGKPGQGGGGGGGAGVCMVTRAGPSGGGGGAGGCGGAAGKAGTSGGSSIAVASFNAHVTLVDCTVTAGAGLDGGLGGDGQVGGVGGQQGNQGGGTACPGGKGGKGGRGGSAGGGAGGSSLAIAFQGAAPVATHTTLATSSTGTGALGGDASSAARGAAGLACKTVDLGDASSCVM